MNLLTAFAVALKHRLRFEPYTSYEDIANLVPHLETFAGLATREDPTKAYMKNPSFPKRTGEFLGLSFATSNPRKTIKKAERPLGNLPLEILTYLASFTDEIIQNSQLAIPMQQTLACECLPAPLRPLRIPPLLLRVPGQGTATGCRQRRQLLTGLNRQQHCGPQ